MANWPPDRERILSDAIDQAEAAGWRLISRTTQSAELTSPDGRQGLTLQVNEQGQIQHQQRSTTPQTTAGGTTMNQIGLITSITLAVWVAGVIVITLLVVFASRPGLELIIWVKGCFWLFVGLLLFLAARLAFWKG